SELIDIYVGQESASQQKFQAHKDILTSHSPFFEAAVNSTTWAEGLDKVVRMPDDDPEAFGIWLQLTYTGKMGIEDGSMEGNRVYELLMMVYVMAEKLIDSRTMDICMEATLKRMRTMQHDGYRHFPGSKPIRILYGGTPESSPMRRLLVDAY
ncbi:hypothetical protein BU26DRAFT_395163, partial [Trematosphaeria pertusa]